MDELNKIKEELEKFNQDYYEKVTANNAQQVISEFKPEWKIITDYSIDETSDRLSKYGIALVVLSAAYYEKPTTEETDLKYLEELVKKFDENENVKYKFSIKQVLYRNIGMCWHKLGDSYKCNALEAFKKYVYYLIVMSSHTKHCITAYAFRSCSEYLYKSLINEQLNLSSPIVFNDPFDCPVLELLNKNEDVTALLRQAYKECLKIACFTSNTKLPQRDGLKKNIDDKDEFLNTLMWAHYANSHKGICIKYNFSSDISKIGDDDPNVVAYFKDVIYSSEDLVKYSNKDAINFYDAFFLKGDDWKYENELRFLHYDKNGKGDYASIDIPNCIEAIYFGLECSEDDRNSIMNVMKDKKFVKRDINGKSVGEKLVEFYQMKIDKEHFGQIRAEKI